MSRRGRVTMPAARAFEKVPFDRSSFSDEKFGQALTNSRVYACSSAGKFGSGACRIIDDPGGNDHDDQQPKRILTDSAQNRGCRFRRFTLIARNVGQYITISVKLLGQHRHFGLVPAMIYVARQAGKNNSRNFQCSANDECFLPCFELRTDGFKSGPQEQQIYPRASSAFGRFSHRLPGYRLLNAIGPRKGLLTLIPRLLLP